jgi:sulfite reductase (NADPH) flavoprotein alpha-component
VNLRLKKGYLQGSHLRLKSRNRLHVEFLYVSSGDFFLLLSMVHLSQTDFASSGYTSLPLHLRTSPLPRSDLSSSSKSSCFMVDCSCAITMSTANGTTGGTEVSPNIPIDGYVSLNQLDTGRNIYASTLALVQQVSYVLSDKVFAYSPESFDLDTAVTKWQSEQSKNGFGFVPTIQQLETRLGAGNIALGYVFSPDFDLSKRHIPQTILASSGSLLNLRESLNQLSLLHALANPIVTHISSADYIGEVDGGLVSDYCTALELTDELGFGLVNSISAQDAQHMSLFATLLAKVALPSIHIFDGLSAQDTLVINQLCSQKDIIQIFNSVSKQLSVVESKHLDNEGKALKVFKLLNDKLRTKYKPFEYHGHKQAEHVLVTFGNTESLLAAKVATALAKKAKVGCINVRLYRPFIEEEFLRALPRSVRSITVLGQVESESHAADSDLHSRLYQDVLAALTFSALDGRSVQISDEKYSRQQTWDLESITALFAKLTRATVDTFGQIFQTQSDLAHLSIWTLDDSIYSKSSSGIANMVASLPNSNIILHQVHDNLIQGGLSRYDISSSSSLHPFSANAVFISSEKILTEVNVLHNVQVGGAIILGLPGVKDEDIEKKLPEEFRTGLVTKDLDVWVLDNTASPLVAADDKLAGPLLQLALLKVLQELNIDTGSSRPVTDDFTAEVDQALRRFEIPEAWRTEETNEKSTLRIRLTGNSFIPFNRSDQETASQLEDWTIAAKGAVFKEAYGTQSVLRPDIGVKTGVVHVMEHRRLTPMSYDRNVFHIEFDLGDSGITYAIGEALGIHAENDPQEVEEFIKWYGLNPDEVVQVPSREDPSILENRTVYQALIQNVDIFGRPPKRFYESLADFATDENDKKNLLTLSVPEGATEFKRRAEVDTITFADILAEFPSAHPSFHDLIRIVSPLKRREYSIASSQHATPNSVSLLIVTVEWVDPKSRDRFGLATRYLNNLKVGAPLTVSIKPSVMKLPLKSTSPIVMAGLGTGLAPFRAFVQERAYQRDVLKQEIGSVLLYLGSRHQREEYLYGEEWEAYQAAGVITLIGKAFSRDQPNKIYIQDRMRQTMEDIRQAYIRDKGSFYLCGPTWPVPDVTEVLQEAVEVELKAQGAKKVDGRREIETLKEGGRFVLEVY